MSTDLATRPEPEIDVLEPEDGQRGTALTHVPAGAMMPVDQVDRLVTAMQAFQEVKRRIMSPSDYQETNGRNFPKKSFYTKLLIAYGVSSGPCDGYPVFEYDDSGRPISATVKAYAEWHGRRSEANGRCDITEPRYTDRNGKPIWTARQKLAHDLSGTAETRAINRACQRLFGEPETSWEEVQGSPDDPNVAADRPEPVYPRGAPKAEKGDWNLVGVDASALAKLRREGGLDGAETKRVMLDAKVACGIQAGRQADYTKPMIAAMRTWIAERVADLTAPQPEFEPGEGELADEIVDAEVTATDVDAAGTSEAPFDAAPEGEAF